MFSRRQLLERVWGFDYYGDERVVDVHIRNLRRALGDDADAPTWIATVRGVGYKFVETSSMRHVSMRTRLLVSFAMVAVTGAAAFYVAARVPRPASVRPTDGQRRDGQMGTGDRVGARQHDALVSAVNTSMLIALAATLGMLDAASPS